MDYVVDPAAVGATFHGIGAISGGGGETVFLPSYPKVQRDEVLDFLFKPSFGAALHTLKLEIGGDSLSTDGAEPSHMSSLAEMNSPNYERGYEYWVAEEATRRNKAIQIYGLPWEVRTATVCHHARHLTQIVAANSFHPGSVDARRHRATIAARTPTSRGPPPTRWDGRKERAMPTA